MKKFDLLSFGEALLRLSPPNSDRMVSGDVFEKRVGGAELNVVSGVSLLGLRTGIISKLPDNAIGTFAKNRIRFAGVSDDYLVYDSDPDARLGVYYYETGAYPRKPSVVYDRLHTSMRKVNSAEFPASMYENARCFHTTGITLALNDACRETAIEMMQRFKRGGALISFDVNFRGNLWTGSQARACIERILPLVDLFFCSEETARLTFGKQGTAEEIMQSFAEEYPISMIASTQRIVHSPKRHTFGSVIYDAKEKKFYREEPYRDIDVVDRIGSGDAYISGVLYGLLSEGGCCRKALEFGNACGAVKDTIPGDMPMSDGAEISRIIRDHHAVGAVSEMDR